MPVVTVDPSEWERVDLASAPPDGYVMVRPLPYGMRLTMRDKAFRQRMMQEIPRKGQARKQRDEIPVEFISDNEWATHFELSYCIGDHNLTDANGTKLDFTSPMALKQLNPKVGAELEKIMLDLNADEDDETIEDFLKRQSNSSSDQNVPETDSGDQQQKETTTGSKSL